MPARGTLPKAYLRIDPNIDRAKADTQWAFIRLLCEANRQPRRGMFKNRALFYALLGRASARKLIEAGDAVELESGIVLVPGWEEWQEGDVTVGDRMRRMRARRAAEPLSGAERTAAWRLRTRVFERDNHTCRYCGNVEYEREWLILEHVDPDGPSDEQNLVTACRPCNKQKGHRTPEQAGMVLLPEPSDASPNVTSDASPSTSQRIAPSPSTRYRSSTDEGVGRETAANGAGIPPIEAGLSQLLRRSPSPGQLSAIEDFDHELGGGLVEATIGNLIDDRPARNVFGVLLEQLRDTKAQLRPRRNGHAIGPPRNPENDYDSLAEAPQHEAAT